MGKASEMVTVTKINDRVTVVQSKIATGIVHRTMLVTRDGDGWLVSSGASNRIQSCATYEIAIARATERAAA